MRKVQMLEFISGGRHDGTEWPPVGSALTVPDWEAEDLIRGRLARPWPGGDEPDPKPAPTQAEPPVQPEPSVPAEPAVAPADPAAETAQPPRPAAPKAEWVAWAVSSGASEDEANGLSKAELMERYGGRA